MSGVLIHRVGGQCSTDKNGGWISLKTKHEIRYCQRKITSIVNFFYKSMKFCKVVVHGLTYDINYDVKLNRPKI